MQGHHIAHPTRKYNTPVLHQLNRLPIVIVLILLGVHGYLALLQLHRQLASLQVRGEGILTASARPPAKLSPLVLAPELLFPVALFLSGVPATPGLFGGAGGFFLSMPFGLFGGGGATFLVTISSKYALGAQP